MPFPLAVALLCFVFNLSWAANQELERFDSTHDSRQYSQVHLFSLPIKQWAQGIDFEDYRQFEVEMKRAVRIGILFKNGALLDLIQANQIEQIDINSIQVHNPNPNEAPQWIPYQNIREIQLMVRDSTAGDTSHVQLFQALIYRVPVDSEPLEISNPSPMDQQSLQATGWSKGQKLNSFAQFETEMRQKIEHFEIKLKSGALLTKLDPNRLGQMNPSGLEINAQDSDYSSKWIPYSEIQEIQVRWGDYRLRDSSSVKYNRLRYDLSNVFAIPGAAFVVIGGFGLEALQSSPSFKSLNEFGIYLGFCLGSFTSGLALLYVAEQIAPFRSEYMAGGPDSLKVYGRIYRFD